MDAEQIAEEGVWFAFNKSLEICFETHKLAPNVPIVFREWGYCYNAFIKIFKNAVKVLPTDKECNFLHEVWLEHLIKAVELQGAKIPKK